MNERGAGDAPSRKKGRPEAETWVVDRVEGRITVLVAAEDVAATDRGADDASEEDEPVVVEVASALLGDHAVEGAVLRVPLGDVGEPVWDAAERDTAAEEARRAEGEAMLERLKRRDPGGDVIL
jgi:hypothetical protein